MRDPDEGALLRPDRGQRGRRGDQALQDRDRPRRRRRLPGRVPRHHPRRRWRSAAWSPTRRRSANGVPGVHFFPYSHCADCPLGLTRDTLRDQLRRAPGAVAAATRNGGIAAAGRGDRWRWCRARAAWCPRTPSSCAGSGALTRALDVPLIVDEVQTGCGRTGTWFAFEQYGIEPDVDRGVQGAVRDRPAGRDHPLRRAAGRLGAGRAHRHLPRQPAGVRRRGGDRARSSAATTCWATSGARGEQIAQRLDGLRAAPLGARRARPRPDVGHRAGRPRDRRPRGRARRAVQAPRAAPRA